MQRLSPAPHRPRVLVSALVELGEAAGVVLAVVAFGLGLALWLGPARLSGAAYPAPAMTPSDSSSGSLPPSLSAGAPSPAEPAVEEWLVDGFNLLHAVLLGGEERSSWWTAAARERVLVAVEEATRAEPCAAADVTPGGARAPDGAVREGGASDGPPSAASVWVVFDGSRSPAAAPSTPGTESVAAGGRLQSVFAPSADDWLVRRVKQARDPARVVVVTADRKLANRARHHGARVLSPREFLARKA
ncbi:MAG: NYN domain-containing protein [Myxococcota bacterium]